MREGTLLVIVGGVKSLAPGFLIAMPQLGDPNFHRSVVLMLEHNEQGSMGLVVNHPSTLTLGDLGASQNMAVAPEREPQPVMSGGPVEAQRGFVLHDYEHVEEKQLLLPGLYLSLTMDALAPILAAEIGRVRFCLGYAGWGPKQLENELAEGSWLFCEADPSAVLETEPAQLWEETVRKMGVDPAMLLPARGVH